MRNALPYHGGQIASGEAIKDEAAMLGKAREQVNVRQEMPLVRLAPKQSSLLSFRSQVYRRGICFLPAAKQQIPGATRQRFGMTIIYEA
jgi:hypothetical protein